VLGGIFVVEALSVLIQVFSFQTFRKRVFLMAPVHHHFEILGWSETKIILRFWIVAAVGGGDRLHRLPAVGERLRASCRGVLTSRTCAGVSPADAAATCVPCHAGPPAEHPPARHPSTRTLAPAAAAGRGSWSGSRARARRAGGPGARGERAAGSTAAGRRPRRARARARVVKSPGVPAAGAGDRAARASAAPGAGEVELAWRLIPNEFIAVTGTNGKTTTAELIGHIHREAGRPVAVAATSAPR
jgi:hypothetical protein